jgi:FOG: Transposase
MGMISDINRKTLPEIAKVMGREKHQGLHHFLSESPWEVVTEANAPERLGAAVGLMEAALELSELKIIWVDSGYSPLLSLSAENNLGWL